MSTLIVPALDDEPWPTLGGQICDFLEAQSIYGPGSLKGQPYLITSEFRAVIYRIYEVFPRGHELAGLRRFDRAAISERKGKAKTEKAAQIAYAELHPEGPVRFDGWDAHGQPVGRPVADPYIPLLAYTKDQSDELAYNVLLTICLEGPAADLFDAGTERIIRLGPRGMADGKAVGLAGSPNANDGARTTFQVFDETHRMVLPRLKEAVETMLANTPKRQAEDPWTLMATTAGALGEGSVAEDVHEEAKKISEGKITDPKLFYFHRDASPGHNLETIEGRVAAVREATGPDGEFGRGQFLRIAQQWDREGADHSYLERVWLNRWVASSATAFSVERWNLQERSLPKLKRRSLVVAGFDGARFRDSTGIVLTDIETGQQQRWALWERPDDVDEWEVDEGEVTESVAQMMKEFQVWRFYCDPPYWTAPIGGWQQRWPEQVKEFWTARKTQMAWAVRAYSEAITSGAVTHDGDADFARHIANAGRRDVEIYDDEGKKLFLLRKLHKDRKFDLAMAGCISWRAFLDARAKGVRRRKRRAPRQIR